MSGLSPMEQLIGFAEWENRRNPPPDGKEHIAMWALREIERMGLAPNSWIDGPFERGALVRKKSGSQWQGHVVGWYSTTLTPCGYAVESETHRGSVQIYPAAALERVDA